MTPSGSRRPRADPKLDLLDVGIISSGIGLILIATAGPLTNALSRILPWRGQVTSRGTYFPHFLEVGPAIVERFGLLLLATPIVTVVASRVSGRLGHRYIPAAMAATVVAATAGWIGWLASPHNGFPSNARIHWVDYLVRDPDDFLYAAGRLPRWLFYDTPALWQSINAALLVGLCIGVGRRLGHSLLVSSALAGVVATAGNLLRFANTAEDVFINAALVLLVIYASLTRRPIVFGATLALLFLGRPQFAAIFPAVLLAEVATGIRHQRRPDWRFTIVVGGTTLAGVAFFQGLFTILGRRSLFVSGRILYTPQWDDLAPIEIDGFTISAFSGSYVLHFVWSLPLATLLLALLSLVRASRLTTSQETSVYFCAFSCVALLALHEASPLFYFNIRYLTYLFPFLLVMSWAAPATFSREVQPKGVLPIRQSLIVLALLAPMTIPGLGNAIRLKQNLQERPAIELLGVRGELRELTQDRRVIVASSSRSARNFVTYVLRRDVTQVEMSTDGFSQEDAIIITFEPLAPGGADTVLKTDRVTVIDGASSSD